MAYQSEYALENEMMNQLEQLGYERVTIRDNKQLLDNFRTILNERHADKLEGNPLTDKEFQRLLTMIDGKSIFESARILRDKLPLRRDDESEIYLSFLDTKSWCKNKFQVTNQVSVEDTYKARYDVTILINGLPLVQVELKRRGIDINEAFNQVKRYRKQNYTGLFRYIQMFIISNGVETRYFSNNDSELLKSHMFYWSDKQNNRINTLQSFAESFMRPCQLAKMISRYMIINETDRILMAMRPYQVYAVESLIQQATETGNNGYVWHTTGSGKTLTSFKASQILSQQDDIKKVIFLVDRKDLDSQTEEEFNKFAKGAVDKTFNTSQLVRQLNDKSLPLIVTTIQKMAKAIQGNAHLLKQYKTNKVVFIIDECHRSQLRTEILKLHKRLNTTTIYVTHDQTEALTMASRIVVLKDGDIMQVGTPREIYDAPNCIFVAQFIGSPAMNMLNATVEMDGLKVGTHHFKLHNKKFEKLKAAGYLDKEIILGIRAEDIHEEPIFIQTSPETQFESEVVVSELLGSEIMVHSTFQGMELISKLDSRTQVMANDKITLAFDMNKCHFFDEKTGNRIV